MLRSASSLFKLSIHSRQLLNHVPKLVSLQVNHIYGDSYLKIDLFTQVRDRIDQQFGPAKEKFFERVKQQVGEGSEGQLVFTEDLKNVTYLIQNNPEDLELIEKMLRKYSTQNSEIRFGTFNFGPIVMRLLHHFNQPDLALKLIKDESLDVFFGQVNAFLLAMNLLYRNNRYQDVLDVFDLIKSRECFVLKYPHDCVSQFMAAARKLNTPESYERAKQLVSNIRKAGTTIQVRGTCLIASLALAQNDPGAALEILSTLQRPGPVDRTLKLFAFSQLNRPEDAIAVLRGMTSTPVSFEKLPLIHEEALAAVREALNKKEDKATLISEFERVCDELKQRGMIKTNSIEEYLDKQIERRVFSQEERVNERIGLGSGPRRGLNMPNDYQRDRDDRGFDRERGQRFDNRSGGYNDRRGGFGDRRSGGFTGYSQRRGLNDQAHDDIDDYSRDKQRFASRKLVEE